ncbi:TetR/AcrR family transcriptional regulator [Bacillus sp. FJAT-26390]|uniref:TetR/AcrR family transcriptional regulator n=1 Tax=Bacillus sp. FJAT-26390 TaxID=1743142 RepID=UPI000807C47C|nr:TetR/AcrR family transcriptional regulator [Bacillus sp. FJAT-26390]OBZ07713.1 TetR family transcriptional regulator [Bacillus sp. FJAT-26390]
MPIDNPKTDRRIIRSKEALKQALLALMSQKPFSSISITEIVEHANYNRGTFYSHYENKEGLLDDILNQLISELIKSFRAPYENTELFRIDELSANAVMIFEHIFQNASIYTVLLSSEVLPDIREKMFLALKQILIEDLDNADTTLNREFHVIYSIHALLGLVFHWIEGGFKYSPEYMQEQLVRIIHWHPSTLINKHNAAKRNLNHQ